jgi:hypothetical protein
MNRYHLFFSTSIHSHFVALIVALYRLYEKRRDTYNIPRLTDLLEKEGRVSAAAPSLDSCQERKGSSSLEKSVRGSQ